MCLLKLFTLLLLGLHSSNLMAMAPADATRSRRTGRSDLESGTEGPGVITAEWEMAREHPFATDLRATLLATVRNTGECCCMSMVTTGIIYGIAKMGAIALRHFDERQHCKLD